MSEARALRPDAALPPQTAAPPLLAARGLRKSFGDNLVLRGVDLTVNPGEFVTLLGASGCGKTTTLRILAGLETPDAGVVTLDGLDITALPPEKRAVNTVFQNYALFPHLNAVQNVAYGLRVRRVPRAAALARAREMLHIVQLDGFESRMPHQLSGGQRQRVAIARAAVLQPRLLLLDEPLGALDLKLRRSMQLELKEMQRTLDIAFVYITHDQEEALNMSDRICIMRDGVILQSGTPGDIYERPADIYCASFIGETNLFRGVISALTPGRSAALDMGGLTLPCALTPERAVALGDRVCLCVRTERVHYGPAPRMGVYLSGTLSALRYAGGTRRAVIRLSSGQEIVSVGQSEEAADIQPGARVFIYWNPERAALVPDAPEEKE